MAVANRKMRSIGVSAVTLTDLLPSWERSMQARNLARRSVEEYGKRIVRFIRWLHRQDDGGRVDRLSAVTKADVERYLAESLRDGAAAKSVQDYHGALKTFYNWCVAEGELTRSPMDGIRTPLVPDSPPPMLRDEDLLDLIKACEGNDFAARRDMAIIRLLIDCGLRLSELAGIMLDDLNLARGEVLVHGKGRKDRTVPYHSKTAQALDRYLRIRARHMDAAKDALWLGGKGTLKSNGVYQIVKRRAALARIPQRVWPHLLRHGWADNWLEEGGQEHAGARLAGWSSPDQFKRYGAAREEERAREAAKKMKGGDRL